MSPNPFTVVVEPRSVPDAFLLENPWKQDVVNGVPWFTGINSDEGCLRAASEYRYSQWSYMCFIAVTFRLFCFHLGFLRSPELLDDLNRNYDRFLPVAFYYGDWVGSAYASTITASIKQFYFGNEDFSANDISKLVRVRISTASLAQPEKILYSLLNDVWEKFSRLSWEMMSFSENEDPLHPYNRICKNVLLWPDVHRWRDRAHCYRSCSST